MMPVTTARQLRASLISTVRGIAVAHPLHQNMAWAPVEAISDVPGGRVRSFYLHLAPGTEFNEGVVSDACERAAELRIYACYSGLDDTDMAGLIDEDATQLLVALDYAVEPQIDGFYSVRSVGWSPEDDTPGSVWGYHAFDIRYLVSHEV